jgi:hypothetical protein
VSDRDHVYGDRVHDGSDHLRSWMSQFVSLVLHLSAVLEVASSSSPITG